MARNQTFSATFFIAPDGTIVPKAKPVSPKIRRLIFERDGRTCQYCGAGLRLFRSTAPGGRSGPFAPALAHVDHIVPVARGGQTTLDNLVLACETCNESKAAD